MVSFVIFLVISEQLFLSRTGFGAVLSAAVAKISAGLNLKRAALVLPSERDRRLLLLQGIVPLFHILHRITLICFYWQRNIGLESFLQLLRAEVLFTAHLRGRTLLAYLPIVLYVAFLCL